MGEMSGCDHQLEWYTPLLSHWMFSLVGWSFQNYSILVKRAKYRLEMKLAEFQQILRSSCKQGLWLIATWGPDWLQLGVPFTNMGM